MADMIPPDFFLGYSPLTLEQHPLVAPTPSAQRRWHATRARRKLMEGAWHMDLFQWAMRERDEALLNAMGHLDCSECLYKSVVEQLAVLYEQEPVITHPDGDTIAPEFMESLGHLFGLHQQVDGAVRAYSEAAVVVDVIPQLWGPPKPSPVLVLPDECEAEPVQHGSRQLARFWRANRRPVPFDSCTFQWGWDYWDLSGGVPRFHFLASNGGPVSGYCCVGDGEDGSQPYPWRYADGVPFIPAVLYHAEPGNRLWSPYRWPELARATLEDAMQWSDWRGALQDASYILRVLWDGEVDGTQQDGDGSTSTAHVQAMPNILLRLRSTDHGMPGRTETLAAPVDVEAQARAIALRHKLRAHTFGLQPSEIEATTTESGVALTIRKEGQRRAQRRIAPQARQGDLELIRMWAATHAMLGLPSAPEQGWKINYPAWPETAEEATSRRADEQHDLDNKLDDRAGILMRRHRISREAAVVMVATIDAAEAEVQAAAAALGAAGAASPTPGEPESEGGAPASVALPLEPPPPRPEEPEHPYSGRLDYQGLPILVETAAGETRSGVDPDGVPWSVTMPWHYGEIEGTLGMDGDPVDVMVGPDPAASKVYVFHLCVPGTAIRAEEDKAYLGFASVEAALAAFRAAYDRDDILAGYTEWSFAEFSTWVTDPANDGLRLDAPPRSGLPARAVDLEAAAEAEAEAEAEQENPEEPTAEQEPQADLPEEEPAKEPEEEEEEPEEEPAGA